MECNKEEAIRAKGIAEKRMQSKDFTGAQKIALKAQKLYPGLENISQMLIVCEVHVSAEVKVGTEMDWYGILQVPHTADEPFIKKQYRKLALVLHPDKNKFPGAEAAFKLIGEANRVLCDQAKRSMYDIKRRNYQSIMIKQQHPQMNKSRNPNKQAGFQNNFASHSTSQHPGTSQPHQPQTQNPITFWTSCPFCSTRYQHLRTFVNSVINCQTCLHPFVAHELILRGGPAGAKSGYSINQSAASHPKDIPNQAAHQTGQKSTIGGSSSSMRCQESTSSGAGMSESLSKTRTSTDGGRSRGKDSEDGEINREAQTGKPSGNAGQKRGRNVAAETRDVEQVEGEEMESSPIKKMKKESSKDDENLGVNFTVTSNVNIQANGSILYPEPEFYDFDKDRVQEKFKVDQMWAVYDDGDGMPRWYVRIRKIFSNGSRLRILWLEANPRDQDGVNWLEGDLPVACGYFRNGRVQDTGDLLMFSHLVSWEKGDARCTYRIYPKKGDVWALFKDWSVEWSSSPDAHRKCEFEFVEVLCDYVEGAGVEVACLVMLEGFTSLFHRMENMGKNPFQIPPNELLRFSHRVPCYRMTGEERQGVPAGSFELDPASVFAEGVKVVNDNNCSKSGTENEASAAGGPEKLNETNIARPNGKDMQNKENFDNVTGTKCDTGKETPAPEADVLNAPKKSTTPNEKGVHEKGNFVYRRCSPRKMIGAHEKKPSRADGSQHQRPQHGPGSLDDMPDNGPGHSILSKGHKKENFIYRRCSPRKMIGAYEKKPSQADGSQYERPQHGPGSLDDMRDDGPGHSILTEAAEKVLSKGATEEDFPSAPVFHSFESEKVNGLNQGQIWALYSEQDGGLPKYYALIRKIELQEFEVHATWLEACPQSVKEIWWSRRELPITCGKFKVQTDETQTYKTASLFSHRVRYTSTEGGYLILPKKGEVWVIYKNWDASWTFKDLEHCEYEVVEVLDDAHFALEVMVLEIVDGYRTICRGGVKMNIPRDEMLRFSHLVPSFRLTKEGGGALSGCLELDPLALPDSFLRKKLK